MCRNVAVAVSLSALLVALAGCSRQELMEKDQKIKALNEQVYSLQDENTALKKAQEEAGSAKQKLEAEVASLKQQLEQAAQKPDTAEELKNLRARNIELTAELEQRTARIAQLEAQNAQMKARLTELMQQVEDLRKSLRP